MSFDSPAQKRDFLYEPVEKTATKARDNMKSNKSITELTNQKILNTYGQKYPQTKGTVWVNQKKKDPIGLNSDLPSNTKLFSLHQNSINGPYDDSVFSKETKIKVNEIGFDTPVSSGREKLFENSQSRNNKIQSQRSLLSVDRERTIHLIDNNLKLSAFMIQSPVRS